ncbi:uncharacterized protein LOC129957368 isoform X1 [Argiope bruennichi]|uniref:uncharacterized protein LOC129957368 isoform X1 n=1 Tax=Argiope bruennichi TaxID=94029 RepID=UPI0024958D2D|nr:uncharacterized protein LOC129957368 isoform X1 [Argiope bruennichi]
MESVFSDRGSGPQLNDTKPRINEPKASNRNKRNSKQGVLWLILRSAIFTLCLATCLYQSLSFYKHYITYPLTTSITIINRKVFKKPAITFCNRSPFRREKFCMNHPSFCQHPYEVKEFCEEHGHFCKGINISTLMIPKLGYYASEPSTEFKEFLFQSYRNYTLDKSLFRLRFGRNEMKYLLIADPSETFTENGKLVRCHSKNLHLVSAGEPEIQEIDSTKEERTQIDFFRLKVRKEDIFFPWTGNQIFLSIHSPFVPVNPLLEGNYLKSGYEYNIYVRLDEEHLQPYPYETNCTDYDALWRKNNKTGFRSQEMCKAMCYLSYSRACFDCEKPKVMLYQPENLCSDQTEWSGCRDANATERLDDCRRNCKPACLKLKYYFSLVKIEKKDRSVSTVSPMFFAFVKVK